MKVSQLIAERLQHKRLQMGLSQGELAEAVGIGRTSICNIELGRQNPPLELIYKICKELKTDIHSILPTEEEINSPENAEQRKILTRLKDFGISENIIEQVKEKFHQPKQ